MQITFREKAKNYIKQNEGCSLSTYRDSLGHYTLGWGHLIKHGENFTGVELTQEFVDRLFERDFAETYRQFSDLILNHSLFDIGNYRQIALLDMTYHLGAASVALFSRTLAYLRQHNFKAASEEVLRSNYARQTPLRARRTSFMFEHDTYPPDELF